MPEPKSIDPTGNAKEETAYCMHDSIIELQNVTKTFESNTVVKDVNMSIRAGEFVTLLGPSGSGKTTILRMIAGFEKPTAGRIAISGAEINDVPAHRRPVNTVFQQYALFPHLNVFDNIAFGLRLKKYPRSDIEKRVKAALAMVRMDPYIKAKVRKLSGGQQQRVAIARAIVNEPKVLLLDEPLGALDMKLRREMQLELKRIHRDVGITFIYVTHDQEEAMAMSDRVAVIHSGHLAQFAPPEEIYSQPSTPFVAGFIGETNLIEAIVNDGDTSHWRLSTESFSLTVSKRNHDIRPGERVTLSIRPESMRVVAHAQTQESRQPVVTGTLTERVFVGAMVKTFVRIGPETVLQCLETAVAAQGRRIGEEVALTWNCDHMVMFPT